MIRACTHRARRSMETFAETLATFAAGLTPGTVPRAVAEQAARLLLDTAGVTLAAVPDDFADSVQTVARTLGGPPESSLWGGREQIGMAAAVLANGTLAHGLDYDDTLEEAIVHTGSCCVTAALAAGRGPSRLRAPRCWRRSSPASRSWPRWAARVRAHSIGAASIPPRSAGPSARPRPRAAPRADGGGADHGLRPLRQPGERDHRVPGGRHLDQAPPRRLGGPRRGRRGDARARRLHRPPDGLRGHPRVLPGVRRRGPRRRPPRGARGRARPRVGDPAPHVQGVPVRIDQPALHGLRGPDPHAPRVRSGGDPGDRRAGRRRARSTGSGSRSRRSSGPRPPTAPSSACRTASRSSWWRGRPASTASARRRPGIRVSWRWPARSATSSTRPCPTLGASRGTCGSSSSTGACFEETQDAPRGGPERPLRLEELRAKFRANAAPGPARRAGGPAARAAARDRRGRGCRARRRAPPARGVRG